MPVKDGICNNCGLFHKAKELTTLNHKRICKNCLRERRENKFKDIKQEVDGEFKERIRLEKNAKERAKRAELRKELPLKPKIKPAKEKFVRGLHMYLTKVERQFIFGKCIKAGMDEDAAALRVDSIAKHLKEFVEGLRVQGVEDHEINKRFKEEFAKLCTGGTQ